jgi:hypothetical protein
MFEVQFENGRSVFHENMPFILEGFHPLAEIQKIYPGEIPAIDDYGNTVYIHFNECRNEQSILNKELKLYPLNLYETAKNLLFKIQSDINRKIDYEIEKRHGFFTDIMVVYNDHEPECMICPNEYNRYVDVIVYVNIGICIL